MQFEKPFIDASEVLDREVTIVDAEQTAFAMLWIFRPSELVDHTPQVTVWEYLFGHERVAIGVEQPPIVGRDAIPPVPTINEIEEGDEIVPKRDLRHGIVGVMAVRDSVESRGNLVSMSGEAAIPRIHLVPPIGQQLPIFRVHDEQ